MSNTTLALKAPLTGPLMALENVPDPVFSQKMVGDGISIDPVNQCLVAPCDGKVIQLHRACHAVTIEADNGLQVLMHIGIDTVGMGGVGFNARVAMGDSVKSGDPLIEFDADYLATQAKSLLTQIIITNSDEVQSFKYSEGFARVGQDIVLELTPKGKSASNDNAAFEPITSSNIAVPNPTGLHARPTAVLVAEAKKFTSVIHLYKGGEQANAKSLVSIMALEVNCGDEINLVAKGPDAEQALDTLIPLIASGLGEDCPPISESLGQPVVEEPDSNDDEAVPLSSDPELILGVCASPGLAIGQVVQLKHEDIIVTETADNTKQEFDSLERALKKAHEQLQALHDKLEDKEKAAIFTAHQELLEDPELIEATHELIHDGKSAAFAWKQAYTTQATQIGKLKNELLAARANDLRDVGRRVLWLVLGKETGETALPENTILIAEDLTPSDTANLDREKVLGFCTMTGGASSHVAILARSMNLPAIAGIESRALKIENGTQVILDATNASLRLNPSTEAIAKIKREQEQLAIKRERDLKEAKLPATTTCGHTMEVVANIANAQDAADSQGLGGEGVGLLRSEFLFMNRATAPTEDEQFKAYTDVVKALAPKQPLIIRTLDVGGDKPLPYLPIEAEENPFLGLRGIRVMLQRTKLFRAQLRAILRASQQGNVQVMFPMITTMEDLRSAKSILEEERVKLGIDPIPVGIMVEVPATAVMAEQFAEEVDFFSIGTNDLTQYTLAIDRGHPTLAAQADGLNPAVLDLIGKTVAGAHKHNKWAGVCGGIASDPLAVPILLGLGVDELSVSVPSIPSIKAQIRELDVASCKTLAARAIKAKTAAEVRALTNQ
ncbi:Phosphoenolpyruvate-protein phosphotransferase [Thalassocella blandensis]|nr:Phosphoenolpyruvate-protein phosphotransferase [Thalassocella blandensis]